LRSAAKNPVSAVSSSSIGGTGLRIAYGDGANSLEANPAAVQVRAARTLFSQGSFMLWLKALHIVFVITWFAGLFYLPRLFVYHAALEASDRAGAERFKIMERRLFAMMTVGGVLALVFGMATLMQVPGFLQTGWMHAKLTLVAGLIGYHVWCHRLLLRFRQDRNQRSERWYRGFNEVPTLFLFGIVILVVVKPF
jgi:putative membrane protein